MRLGQMLLLSSFIFLTVSCGKSDFQKALNYQNDGEYDKAISIYNKVISSGQNVSEAEKNKGDIFFSKKEYDKAFESYKKSIEANPENSLDHIVNFLSDRDKAIRDMTIKMLVDIDSHKAKEKIFEMLSEMLKSDKQYQKLDALSAIAGFKNYATPVITEVIELVDSDSPTVVDAALLTIPAMAEIASKNGVQEKVLKIVNGTNEVLSMKAMDCIEKMPNKFAPYAKDIIAIYQDKETLQNKALSVLNSMERISKEDALKIKDYLYDEDNDIVITVLNMYGKMDQDADIFVPDLIVLSQSKNNAISSKAKDIIDVIKKAAPETVPELKKLLNSPNHKIRIMAISELGNLGPDAVSATAELKALAKDSNPEASRAATLALKNIESKK